MHRSSNSRFLSLWSSVAGVCLATLFTLSAGAQSTGVLNIRESAGFVTDSIDFAPLGTGSGAFVIDPYTQTGSFAALAGTAGVITDLVGQPVGTPIAVNFITFAAEPATVVTLTLIQPGVASSIPCFVAPAASQTCTPTGSPFTFSNVPGRSGGFSSSVSISLQGTIQRPASPLRLWRATLTSQFPVSYQAAFTAMAAGSLDESWSMELVEEAAP